MANTKEQIEDAIDSGLASGSNIAASEHRTVLKDDEESVLEGFYADTVLEENTGLHPITIPNSNFAYSLNFSKVGRHIHITGAIIVMSGNALPVNTEILSIDTFETPYINLINAYGLLTNSNSGEHIECKLIGNSLQISQPININERFKISLTYYSRY